MRPVYLISKTAYEGVIHIPVLAISFLTPDIDFSEYEGVVVTSKQAIKALQQYTFSWKNLKCICVSEGTAEAARQAGAAEVEVGDGYGESLPNVLCAEERSGKWLYLRPKVVASDWVETARELGIKIDEAVVYETQCNEDVPHLSIANSGVLIFTSPSSIRCFLQNYSILSSHTIIVIGKTTQKALPAGISSYVSEASSVVSAVDLARQIAAQG